MYRGRIKWPQLEGSCIVRGAKQTWNRRHSLPHGIRQRRRHTHTVAEDRKLSFTGSHWKHNDVAGANKADSHYAQSYLIQNLVESVEASQHKPRHLSHSPSTQLFPQHQNRQGFWFPATPSEQRCICETEERQGDTICSSSWGC